MIEHELFRHIEMALFVQKSQLKSAMSFVQQTLCVAAGTDDTIDESLRAQLVGVSLDNEWNNMAGTYCHHFPICVRKVMAVVGAAMLVELASALRLVKYALPDLNALSWVGSCLSA